MVTFKKIKQTVTGKLLVEGECVSTDSKPIDIIANGSKLFEIDTGSWYFFNESGAAWVKSVRGGAGSITVDELTVTENGTYTPEDEQHAFGPVIVNVPPPEGYISPNDYNDGDLLITEVKNVPPNSSNQVHSFKDANDNYVYTIVTTIGNIPNIADPKSETGVVSNVMDSLVIRALECGGSACIIMGTNAESSSRTYLFRPNIPAYADGRTHSAINDLGTFATSFAMFDTNVETGNPYLSQNGFAIWNCTSGPTWNFLAYMYDTDENMAYEVTQAFRIMTCTLVVTVPALSYEYAGENTPPSNVAFGVNKLYKHFSTIAEISWFSMDMGQDDPYTSYVDGDYYNSEITEGDPVTEDFYTAKIESLEEAAHNYIVAGWGIRDASNALVQKCGVEYTDFLQWMLTEPQFECPYTDTPSMNTIEIWPIYEYSPE